LLINSKPKPLAGLKPHGSQKQHHKRSKNLSDSQFAESAGFIQEPETVPVIPELLSADLSGTVNFGAALKSRSAGPYILYETGGQLSAADENKTHRC